MTHPKQPNILFLQVDQLTAGALSAYGNTYVHAPTLDRLARQGVIFDTCYCNYPLCAPSRFSMATGQLASDVGAFDNGAEFTAEAPTYAHHLRAAGYHTALSGKMHFIGPDQHHGFETRLTPDLYPGDFSWAANWGGDATRDTNDPRVVRIAGVAERTVQIDYDTEVTESAIAHLKTISTDTQPFFLQVSYTHPHDPFLCPQAFWDLYADKPVPMPRTPALSDTEHDPHTLRLLKSFGLHGIDFTDDEIATAIRGYFGAISFIDDQIARVLAALDDTGRADDTLIVFTSDHGEMLGERGLWMKKHFYENALRVPLLASAPWLEPRRVPGLTSLCDLLPTFNAVGGGPDPVEPLEGMDLTPAFTGAPLPDRTIHAEYTGESTPAPIYMVRRGNWKLVSSSADGDRLFNLVDDPEERQNRAGDRDCADRLSALKQAVADRWDDAALTKRVLASQKRRALVRKAHAKGTQPRWNHGEAPGEPSPWYRGQTGYNDWAFSQPSGSKVTTR